MTKHEYKLGDRVTVKLDGVTYEGEIVDDYTDWGDEEPYLYWTVHIDGYGPLAYTEDDMTPVEPVTDA